MRSRGITSDVRDFGAVGDGVTDDFAAIQAAINDVSHKGGGAVIFPTSGRYLITQTLRSQAPVLLKAEVRGDISHISDGDVTSRPTIIWGGPVDPSGMGIGAYMFEQSPPTSGQAIWGGGSEGLEWHGNEIAAVAVHLDNSKYAVFDGKIRSVRFAGLIVNSRSGTTEAFSAKNNIRRLEFVYGTTPVCQNSIGVLIEGNGNIGMTAVPSTQQYIGDLSGLIYSGTLLQITDSDNCHISSVHAAVPLEATGYAVKLLNPGHADDHHLYHSDSNLFLYVDGRIHIDQGLVANTFLHITAERSTISLVNDALWHGEIIDYAAPGHAYQSHKYQLRKKVEIPSGSLVLSNFATTTELSYLWACSVLPKSVPGTNTPRATVMLPPQYDLHDGVLEGIEIYYSSNTDDTGKAYRIEIIATSIVPGVTFGMEGPVETPSFNSGWLSVAGAAAHRPAKLIFTFSTPVTHAGGSLIGVALRRDSPNTVSDTGGDFFILGLRILYKGNGPSTGVGNVAVPEW